MQFTPNKDFFSPELQSQYCVGLSYAVKDDAAHEKLAALLPKWIAAGLVRAGPPDEKAVAAHFAGTGETK
jgi:hypothetical protein